MGRPVNGMMALLAPFPCPSVSSRSAAAKVACEITTALTKRAQMKRGRRTECYARDIARTAAPDDRFAVVRVGERGRYIRDSSTSLAFLSTTVRDKGYLTDASQRHWQWRLMASTTAEGGLFIPISWREEKFLLGSLSRLSEMKCPSSVNCIGSI